MKNIFIYDIQKGHQRPFLYSKVVAVSRCAVFFLMLVKYFNVANYSCAVPKLMKIKIIIMGCQQISSQSCYQRVSKDDKKNDSRVQTLPALEQVQELDLRKDVTNNSLMRGILDKKAHTIQEKQLEASQAELKQVINQITLKFTELLQKNTMLGVEILFRFPTREMKDQILFNYESRSNIHDQVSKPKHIEY